MPYRALFFAQAFILLLVGSIHVVALHYFLYWHHLWLDNPVHFLGGLWAALVASWLILAYRGHFSAWRIAACVIGISAAWEIFELAIGAPREANYFLDTIADLAMDCIGGICGFIIARWLVEHGTIAQNGNQ